MIASATDQERMSQALALAALAEGTTGPNPRVGCVVLQGDRVVGSGFHQAAGQAHAEARALAEAGSLARGATLYVNLEPCAHVGRTPPCVDQLIASGVRRVVAAMRDPDPRVDGRGFDRLRQAGIEVEVGCGEQAARRVNASFVCWHRRRRPLVTLKAAVSLDGMIAAAEGRSRWITGTLSRRFAHRLRLRHDAVLVGAGTVRADDPRLTVRLPGVEGRGVGVVLSSTLDLDPQARIFREGPATVRLYAPHSVAPEPVADWGARTELVRVSASAGRVALGEVLDDLGRQGIQSLLVEGGAETTAAFLSAGLADRVALFVSGKILGSDGATPWTRLTAAAAPDRGWSIRDRQLLPLGEDLLMLGELAGKGEEAGCSPG